MASIVLSDLPIPTKIVKVKRRLRKLEITPIHTHLISPDIPIVNYEASIL